VDERGILEARSTEVHQPSSGACERYDPVACTGDTTTQPAPITQCIRVQAYVLISRFVSLFNDEAVLTLLLVKGSPWSPDGGASMTTRALLLKLISALERHGFTVYASIDQKNGPGGDSRVGETDTWHACRPVSFEGGAPVYHG
jgi:hypothetical protein